MSTSIQLTDRAAKRIKHLMEKQPAGQHLMLRLMVIGGGCSGFQYNFKLDDTINEDDLVFEANGAKAVVDKTSLDIINDSVIDYKESMMGAAFIVENPNAASSCGCGNSFSI